MIAEVWSTALTPTFLLSKSILQFHVKPEMDRTSSRNDINDDDVNNAKLVDEIDQVTETVTELATSFAKGKSDRGLNAIRDRTITYSTTEAGIEN